jgi:prepilin-type N-terminal cleavage/methylation domain-containing protein
VKKPAGRNGFTMIEILVGTAILVLILGFFSVAVKWSKKSGKAVEKTELTSKLRNCSVLLAKQLYLATEFLYPADVSTEFVNQVIFKNNLNEIVAIFLNDAGKVSLYNYSTDEYEEIVPYTINFKGRLTDKKLIQYMIDIEKDEYRFTLQNELSTCNTLP